MLPKLQENKSSTIFKFKIHILLSGIFKSGRKVFTFPSYFIVNTQIRFSLPFYDLGSFRNQLKTSFIKVIGKTPLKYMESNFGPAGPFDSKVNGKCQHFNLKS